MTDEMMRQLEEDGYTLLEQVLSPEECNHYKDILRKAAARYEPHTASHSSRTTHNLANLQEEQRVRNLHNKHIDFMKVISHPRILEAMDFLLKRGSYQDSEPYNLLNNLARSPAPGSKAQQLHLDANLPGAGAFPLSAVAVWLLDDFTELNGATRLVPGSHRFSSFPEDGKTYPEEKVITAPRGSVLVYNAALWHGGGEHRGEGERWGMLIVYGRWWLKPSFDLTKSTPPEIYEQLTDEQKDLLGFRSIPPKDEFTRLSRRSPDFETPAPYSLPGGPLDS